MEHFSHRTPINYLLINLAVADIIFAAFYIANIIPRNSFTPPEGVPGRILCVLLTDATLTWLAGGASVFTLVAIAVERYYAVLYPHSNKGKLTMRKLKVRFSFSSVQQYSRRFNLSLLAWASGFTRTKRDVGGVWKTVSRLTRKEGPILRLWVFSLPDTVMALTAYFSDITYL